MKHADFESLLAGLYGTVRVHETLTYPIWHMWANIGNYWRTLFRARTAWVRNWQAIPMIVDSKPKWVMTYERRRFLRWVPVQVAIVDTLDECFALVKHRRQSPMSFRMNEEGGVTGTTTWSINLKVNANASDELRPKGSDYGAAASGGAGEMHTQAAEEARHGQAEGGNPPQAESSHAREGCAAEEATNEVSEDRAGVLDRRDR